MANKRITAFDEQTSFSADTYVLVDSSSPGTRKLNIKTKVLDVLAGLVAGTGIANGGITTAKIADDNVTNAKLASGSVTWSKMTGVTRLSIDDIDALF